MIMVIGRERMRITGIPMDGGMQTKAGIQHLAKFSMGVADMHGGEQLFGCDRDTWAGGNAVTKRYAHRTDATKTSRVVKQWHMWG